MNHSLLEFIVNIDNICPSFVIFSFVYPKHYKWTQRVNLSNIELQFYFPQHLNHCLSIIENNTAAGLQRVVRNLQAPLYNSALLVFLHRHGLNMLPEYELALVQSAGSHTV